MKKMRLSLSIRITLIALAVLIVGTVAIGVTSYALNKQDAIRLNGDRAVSLAKSVAAAVDPAQFTAILASKEKTAYWQSFKAYIDRVLQENDLAYLYVIGSDYDRDVYYFGEGYPKGGRDAEEIDLGDTQPTDLYAAELYTAISTNAPEVTEVYFIDSIGTLVSGFSPIVDAGGKVIGAVGIDLSVDSVIESSNAFGLTMVLIVVGLCLIFGLIIAWYFKRNLGRPLTELTESAKRIANGDIAAMERRSGRGDEIGELYESFERMVESIKTQSELFEGLSSGDLTIKAPVRCEADVVNSAIDKMADTLNETMQEIRTSSYNVLQGAQQISDGSQALAQGATEQAAVIEELSHSVSGVAAKAKDNAELAKKAAESAGAILTNAEKGSGQMADMIKAVGSINDATGEINKVIKLIEDVAFQTNILALNAAVEAARAGQHGKGFAVVAEEVRSLAAKSAKAAKDTSGLIENSVEKTNLGVKIANDTASSLSAIVDGVKESSAIIDDIARASEDQNGDIEQIDRGLAQVAQVIQLNTATAQQSAASSMEMKDSANTLAELVGRFELRDDDSPKRLSPGI